MNQPQPSGRVSGDVFLLVLGVPFFLGMLGTVAFIESLFGMPAWWVVTAAIALGAITAVIIALAQRRAAAAMLFPLLSFGWFVILLLTLFLFAGEFNRYGRRTEEHSSKQLSDDVVGQQQSAAGEAQV